MKKSTATLGLQIQESADGGYYHVLAYPVTLGATERERRDGDRGWGGVPKDVLPDTVRHASNSYGETQQGLTLGSLQVYSQGNTDDGENRRLYAWELAYKPFKVTRDEAVAMAKTLTTLHKRMDKLDAEYGRPVTYGQYLLRVAKAMGAICMVLPGRYGTRIETLADGAASVDAQIASWVETGLTTEVRRLRSA